MVEYSQDRSVKDPWSVLSIVPENKPGIHLGLDLGINHRINLGIDLENTF